MSKRLIGARGDAGAIIGDDSVQINVDDVTDD